MNTCENCKHWDEEKYEFKERGVRKCNNIPLLCDAEDWNSDGKLIIMDKYKDCKAFTKDASDYRADLLTMKNFSCNQWSEK